jgi:hypothetical protein
VLALPFHFEAEEVRFDAGVPSDAPMRRGELPDQIGFGLIGRGKMIEVLLKLGLVFFLGLIGQNDGLGGQTTCLTALSETARRPSSVFGPCDFAPLIRDASALEGVISVYLAEV